MSEANWRIDSAKPNLKGAQASAYAMFAKFFYFRFWEVWRLGGISWSLSCEWSLKSQRLYLYIYAGI